MRSISGVLDICKLMWPSRAVASALLVFAVITPSAHADYFESFQSWSATNPDTWETKDLSGAPFNVPANAVVEIAVRNSAVGNQRSGGVRAVGSGLERRFTLHEAEGGGYDVVVMHVQADAGSQIQNYSDVVAEVDFVLLGYWDCGTYVEAFQSFSAGGTGSWLDHNLSTYGVSAGEVAEIVMVNAAVSAERQAGVRANGSGLSRLLTIHEAEAGGDDLATMFATADATANATIEVYASQNASVSFYLVGYWTTAPGPYTEAFADIGSPTASATWEDRDLSSFGVPADAVVEILLGNNDIDEEEDIGVRENGSSLGRLLQLQEAEAGGLDYARMHVTADASSTIEFYFQDVADTFDFILTGYWDTGLTLTLDDHATGQEPDAFTQSGGETDAELFAFELTPNKCTISVTQLVFTISSITGLVDGDWTGVEIIVDDNDDGNINGGETTAVGGAGAVNQAAGTITFSTSFDVSAATSYILRADFGSLSDGDEVTIALTNGNITTTATTAGTSTSVTHQEKATLTLSDHAVAQETDAFTESGAETDAELFALELDPGPDSITVTQLVFSLSGVVGLTDGDWAGVEVVVDDNDDGNIGVGETTTVGGSGTVNQGAGTITFSTSFSLSSVTSYILRADFSSLADDDTVTIALTSGNITAGANIVGSTTSAKHLEGLDLVVANHTVGQETDAFMESGTETNAELLAFNLDSGIDTITVDGIVLTITSIVGLTNGDWAGVEIVVDDNDDGSIGGGETTTVGGSGTVDQAAGTITFSTNFNVITATNYIMRADFVTLSDDDEVTIQLASANVTVVAGETLGSTSSVRHREGLPDLLYVPAFQTWTASNPDIWETQDLSGAPFSIPANAVVEVAVLNANETAELWGGVRAVGSGLERRFQLHEAEFGGWDVVVMHVQTDAGSRIQHYADITADVRFILLGHWNCGTYVEAFDTFTAGANASWQDENLSVFSVSANEVAELVMANKAAVNARDAGVRTNGSGLTRTVNLHEAEAGGVDVATMFVTADSTANATIDLYAEVDADVDFYLVGYWTTPPGEYTEKATTIGAPVNDATWEDEDLTVSGVPDNAVAEFVLINGDVNEENNMGVRLNGSTNPRLLNLHEAEAAGGDAGRMHVTTDGDATIEHYMQDVSDAHTFLLAGYWEGLGYDISDLGTLTGDPTVGLGINDTREVVGADEDATTDDERAWIWNSGSLTGLGTLTGGSVSEAQAINDSQEVAGWSDNAAGDQKAFSWTSGGGMTDLGTLSGRTDSEAFGINTQGEIVGTALKLGPPASDRLAFLYLPSAAYGFSAGMNNLGTLGGTESLATDLNDSGEVVGGAQVAGDSMRPFLWLPAAKYGLSVGMNDLGTLGGQNSSVTHRAFGVNSFGEVVGLSYTSGGDAHPFLWLPSANYGLSSGMNDLGTLTGGTTSWAFDINDSGQVVGISEVTGGDFHAFLWETGTLNDLNDLTNSNLNWTLEAATGINGVGEIVGSGTNPGGFTRGFVLIDSCGAAFEQMRLAGNTGDRVAGKVLAQTDADGSLVEAVVDVEDRVLAQIEVLAGDADELFELSVTTPARYFDGAPGPSPGTFVGFANRIGLGRTLEIDASADPESFVATIRMTFYPEEIDEVGVPGRDLKLHVLDRTIGLAPGVWRPAGSDIGESEPTGVIGESGHVVYTDGSVDYWSVGRRVGFFAVGAPGAQIIIPEPDKSTVPGIADDLADDAVDNDVEDDSFAQPLPQGSDMMCGVGVCQFGFVGLLTLISARTRRRNGSGL